MLLRALQETVRERLKKGETYSSMSKETGLPLAIFQQLVFGVCKDLELPLFASEQIRRWAKGTLDARFVLVNERLYRTPQAAG